MIQLTSATPVGLAIRCMIIVYLTLIAISITLSLPRVPQVRLVTINWQIDLDHLKDFSFTKLHATVFHSVDRNGTGERSGLIVPDNNGRFSFSVPAGSQVSLSLMTSDPTVMNAIAQEDHTNYSWQPGQWELISSSDFEVPDESSSIIERKIELLRGGGFVPCIPAGLRRGFVFYWRVPAPSDKRRNVNAFADASVLKDEVFGGLESGRWHVTYKDQDGHKLSTETIYVRIGEVLRRKCH